MAAITRFSGLVAANLGLALQFWGVWCNICAFKGGYLRAAYVGKGLTQLMEVQLW
jgi:hypothetical protein